MAIGIEIASQAPNPCDTSGGRNASTPAAVYAMAVGAFGICVTDFVITGLIQYSSPLVEIWPNGLAHGKDTAVAVLYQMQPVGNVDVFFREAGPRDAPVLLLLHGFPTSSHMFRDLIPLLMRDYHLIAPDLPGFGNTLAPPRGPFAYTFDNLATVVDGFIDALGLGKYSLYVFDYGAPVGYRVAAARPDRVTAIVSQNGNAYIEGFSAAWGPWQSYWRNPTPANREACRESLSPDVIRTWQYGTGAPKNRLAPDGYELDIAYMARPGMADIQLDLILDYRTNPERYPEFQAYFRTFQPPLLAVWGKHDPAFVPAGAAAYRKDIQDAEVHMLDTGHFALETHSEEIAELIDDFLRRKLSR